MRDFFAYLSSPMPFTTIDNDQDTHVDNCAAASGGGW